VIVDKLEGDVLHLRDPWGESGPGSPKGAKATMKLVDFLEHWRRAIHNVIIPLRRKGKG
jgi:hypothetical protein